MGILDLHFHDSEFTFAPSMTNTGETASKGAKKGGKLPKLGLGRSRSSEESETSGMSGTSETTSTGMSEGEESDESSGGSTAKKGLGVVVGLVFLVAIAVLAKKRRGGQESDDLDTNEYGSESVEESIEISD